ncbi:MAG: hypothetical protein H6R24_366 [Proteobacteria bacterium]|jgi:hypothetical protein|nr:hypothetical protein [Pseudomonadota bacterium]MBS1223688.1 hypothetical protein [Pseudomonadota bacterium]MCU0806461.1 hypothetical protein [Candidatus Contendobacter sp.]
MIQLPRDSVPQPQTQAALDAMHAYFTATAQARPQRERQRLALEWLAAVRRLRVTTQ